MKHRLVAIMLVGLSLIGLAACNDDNKNNNNGSVKGSTSARFSALFKASPDSEPADIQEGDAGAISLTNEPNDVM